VMLHSDDPDSFVHQNVINSLHLRWCPDGEFLAMDFLRPVFPATHMQHISDHSKFTLRPHHVWKYGRHPISDR